MGTVDLLKRALPFLGTFALGLFIASFFVNISPGFEHHERGRCHHDMWEMRIENEQLREENQQLREQLDSIGESSSEFNSDGLVVPRTAEMPALPPPPHAPGVRLQRGYGHTGTK